MNKHLKLKKTKGLTLLEIVISVAIFALVATAISVVFNRSLFVYRASTDKNAAVQEAQTATEWLLRDIQSAKDIVVAKADRIEVINPDTDNIAYYYLENTDEIRRQQNGAPVPGHLVARGVTLFSLKYYDLDNIQLVPDATTLTGLSGHGLSLVTAAEIDITTESNTREFTLNTVVRVEHVPHYYWARAYDCGRWIYSLQETEPDRGYIFGGWQCFTTINTNALGNIEWAKFYGGPVCREFSYCLQQTEPDGGYILGGSTRSFGLLDDDPVSGSPDFSNCLLIKIDALGTKEWAKVYCDEEEDRGSQWIESLQQTSDGGYILGGTTYGGWLGWGLPTKYGFLIRTDAQGNVGAETTYPGTWAKVYDVTSVDDRGASVVRQTDDDGDGIEDDGYILGGRGSDCFFLIKTDAQGHVGAAHPGTWINTYAGPTSTSSRKLASLQQTSDGGYILGGRSSGFELRGFLVIKTDSQGRLGAGATGITWAKVYEHQIGYGRHSVQQTFDAAGNPSGYILGTPSHSGGSREILVIKIDSQGDATWAKSYGGSEDDNFYSLQQTADGYIFGGGTYSWGTGGSSSFAIKTDGLGNITCCSHLIDIIEDIPVTDVTSVIVVDEDVGATTHEYNDDPDDDFTVLVYEDPNTSSFPDFTLNVTNFTTLENELVCPVCSP